MDEGKKTLAEMAKDLDEMERDLPSEAASCLDRVLGRLKKKKDPDPKDVRRIEALHERYFGEDRDVLPGRDDDDQEDVG
jgi:hypothetical protein